MCRTLLRQYILTFGSVVILAFTPRYDAKAISGVEGTFEYAFDAPWRIEPSVGPDGKVEYGLIPIQLSVHDALFSAYDNEPAGVPAMLGEFQSVTVVEPGFATTYQLKDLAEVEMTTGFWPWPKTAIPGHIICRVWKGDNPERCRNLSQTSEWNGLLWHKPRVSPKPGMQLPLTIEVHVRQPYPGGLIVLRNHVRVYFGDAPLPRFDSGWLYGDLHYHSQGTDNDGESAYNYRGVVRAMGALGLDFVFATEHASDSEQIIDADVDLEVDITGKNATLLNKTIKGGVLRDMSAQRFAFNHRLIWRPDGVNAEAAINASPERLPQGVLSHGIVPQVFLGGEVDVIPEIQSRQWSIPYGNGLFYDVNKLSGGWSSELKGAGSPNPNKLWEQVGNDYLIRDVQGINEYGYGREHLVYFPKTSAPTVTTVQEEFTFEESVFVGSFTGTYGGASRRLTDVHPKPIGEQPVLPEIERKGYAFLAHHMNAPNGTSGPEGPPWTRSMLEKAFRSSAILGLEFWNENNRFELQVGDLLSGVKYGREVGYERCEEVLDLVIFIVRVCEAFPNNRVRDGFKHSPASFELKPYVPANGSWGELTTLVERTLHHGTASWDQMNHWGLDPVRTSQLRWLGRNEPRRVFMAGGSDAHGDFNYRRTGYFFGTTGTNSTAIGMPRNLVFLGEPKKDGVIAKSGGGGRYVVRRYGHEETVEALREGRFSVTDGPALRIAIDRNGNGKVDEEDITLGGVLRVSELSPMRVKLLIEWISTPEFGPVDRVDVYIGTRTTRDIVDPDETSRSRTYAPEWHGVRDMLADPPSTPSGSYVSGGLTYTEMADGYWLDPTGQLRVAPDVTSSFAYHGTHALEIDLDRFEAMRGVPGQRLFIRAFAKTGPGNGISRFAFTNPIWVIRQVPLVK